MRDANPMIRRLFPLVTLLVLGAGFLALPVASGGAAVTVSPEKEEPAPGEAKPVPYKPVVEIDVIMSKVDDIFGDIGDNLEKKRLRSIRNDAEFLAEMMNVTQHFNKEKKWKDFSVKSRDLLLKLHEAAKSKDEAATASLIKQVDASCEACHDAYDV